LTSQKLNLWRRTGLNPFSNFFKMKTINVQEKVWERLHKLKMKYKFNSLNDLIDALSKIVNKFKPELKDIQLNKTGGKKGKWT